MRRFYIVHGYQASADDHWFPWLSKKIIESGGSYEVLNLTNSQNPHYETWKTCLENQIKNLDEQTVIIAHSLGCLITLDYLSQALKQQRLGAIFLIAPFKQKLGSLPELNQFILSCKVDDALIRSHIDKRMIFLSNNDPYVPAPFSIQLGHLLNAQMHEIKNAGHFMAHEGFLEFPQLWEKIQQMLSHDSIKS